MVNPSSNITTVVLGLLEDNWNPSNCPTPSFAKVWEVKRINLRGNGYVLAYESGGLNKSRGDVEWHSRDWTGSVRIDVRNTTSEAAADLIYDEIDRILMLKRKDPGSNWHKIEEVNRVNLTNRAVGLYRFVLDIKLVARKKIIP